MRFVLGLLLVGVLSAAEVVKEADAKALTAHVSFLASDALEGRETPSKGLDIAAEYIASEFRRAGLEPMSDGTYFQTAKLLVKRVVREGFSLTFTDGEKSISVPAETSFWVARPALSLQGAAVRKISVESLEKLTEPVAEPVVLLTAATPGPGVQRSLTRLAKDGVKLVVLVGMPVPMPAQTLEFADEPPSATVYFRTTDKAADEWLKGLAEGVTTAKANANVAAATIEEHGAKNVIGMIPGTNRDEVLILSAHYDHLGLTRDASDKVFNGANDNASGVASILEVAQLIKGLGVTPKRTLVFMAFFGEERGLLGSRYFTRHPVWPLKNIQANLNLEQTGRTDAVDGAANVNMANLTGYHFSTIHKYMEEAGKETGLNIVKHERFSDPFFSGSDNFAFALVGVPSTTLSVTYQFPDYHKKEDEWPKIDFANHAKVTRAIAQGFWRMGTAEEKVSWNEAEAKTAAFRKARE